MSPMLKIMFAMKHGTHLMSMTSLVLGMSHAKVETRSRLETDHVMETARAVFFLSPPMPPHQKQLKVAQRIFPAGM